MRVGCVEEQSFIIKKIIIIILFWLFFVFTFVLVSSNVLVVDILADEDKGRSIYAHIKLSVKCDSTIYYYWYD